MSELDANAQWNPKETLKNEFAVVEHRGFSSRAVRFTFPGAGSTLRRVLQNSPGREWVDSISANSGG
jgi:hypothetical protein